MRATRLFAVYGEYVLSLSSAVTLASDRQGIKSLSGASPDTLFRAKCFYFNKYVGENLMSAVLIVDWDLMGSVNTHPALCRFLGAVAPARLSLWLTGRDGGTSVPPRDGEMGGEVAGPKVPKDVPSAVCHPAGHPPNQGSQGPSEADKKVFSFAELMKIVVEGGEVRRFECVVGVPTWCM